MKILVTGASGFIGSHVADRLAERGHCVYRSGVSIENPSNHFLATSAEDIMRFSRSSWAFPIIDAVCHLEAETSTTKTWADYIEPNLAVPLTLYAWAKRRGCKRFVWASSAAVYGPETDGEFSTEFDVIPVDRLNTYALAKYRLERLFKDISAADRDVCSLRLSNVYGPGEGHKVQHRTESMIRRILVALIRGERPVLFEYGREERDWIHASDVADAFVAVVESKGLLIDHYNVGAGKSTSFNDLVALSAQALGVESKGVVDYAPMPIALRRTYQVRTCLNSALAKYLFGWNPKISLEDGIRAYADHLAKDEPVPDKE